MQRMLAPYLIGCLISFQTVAQDNLQQDPLHPKPSSSVALKSTESAASPQPEPALAAMLKLFDQYQVVGLADLHGCAELLAFLERLVQAPEFAAKVNDLTWEPGNVRFQELMDGFILRGQDVPLQQLRQCWRENTQSHTYSDTPALFQLLMTVRKVNMALPAEHRVRVLLIDPPVNWSRVQAPEDLRKQNFNRESHMAEVIEREVYAKGRKALFLAGGAHLSRSIASPVPLSRPLPEGGPIQIPLAGPPKTKERPLNSKAPPPDALRAGPVGAPEAVGRMPLIGPLQALERRHPGTTFNITLHEGFGERTEELEARLDNWPKPALARLRGTWWGELDPPPSGDIFVGPDGRRVQPSRGRKIEDSWDAVLFLGKRKELTRVEPPGPDILDAAWVEELRRRKSLRGGPPLDLEAAPAARGRRFFSDETPRDRRFNTEQNP